jgi:hypothetical protein
MAAGRCAMGIVHEMNDAIRDGLIIIVKPEIDRFEALLPG